MYFVLTLLVMHLCDANVECVLDENVFFRFVATELATDIVIIVGEVKFYLHKVHTNSTILQVYCL